MYKALFLKEWLKLRWFICILAVLNIGAIVYMTIYFRAIFEFNAATKIWVAVIHKQKILYGFMKYNALITGVVMALAQFLPETTKKRLKLLFHLPVNHYKAIYFMMVIGFVGTAVLISFSMAVMALVISLYFPLEVVVSFCKTSAPWSVAGLLGYLGLLPIIIETSWWRKICYLVLVYFFIQLFFEGRGYNVYDHSLWKFTLVGAMYLGTVIIPMFRFKKGVR